MIDSPTPTAHLKREMKTGLIRLCGERRIGYNTDVLDLLAGSCAETATKLARRRRTAGTQAAAAVEPPIAPVPPLPCGLVDGDLVLLELMASDLTNEAMARRLGVPYGRLKKQVSALVQALGAGSRLEAVVLGYEFGLLGPAARAAGGAR